jgi:hypothetical protein
MGVEATARRAAVTGSALRPARIGGGVSAPELSPIQDGTAAALQASQGRRGEKGWVGFGTRNVHGKHATSERSREGS